MLLVYVPRNTRGLCKIDNLDYEKNIKLLWLNKY